MQFVFLFDDFVDVPGLSEINSNEELRTQMNYFRARTTLSGRKTDYKKPENYLLEMFEDPLN